MKLVHIPAVTALAVALAVALAGAGAPAPQPRLTDAEIAHIAVTANQLGATAAEQALEKSRQPDVRAFAETMIRDHEAVIGQAAALAERLGVTPEDNETSRGLASTAEATLERLDGLDGAAFDLAYVENEVTYHEAVIAAVEDTLIPNTSNQELKELLQSVLPALEAHREHAERLVGELRGG